MSEYQYYEFVAVDGPISDEGMRYAQGCSSRAEVSPVRWQNTYNFGDFHGSVETLLKYYDAHFYIANWGTTRLGLAFPKGVLSRDSIKPYLRGGDSYETTLTLKSIGNRDLIWWERNEEGGGEWMAGEGIIDQLIGVREEIMRGDYRALFLGWLSDFYPDEAQDSKHGKAVLPPVPDGLEHLSLAQRALIEHFPVDPDALAAAAILSQPGASGRLPLASVLEKLSLAEMRGLLTQVAEGGGTGVMTQLNRLTYPPAQAPSSQTAKCLDFAAKALELREERLAKEAEAAAAKKQRDARQRQTHLASVMQRADSIWSGLPPLMDRQVASAYDQVATQLEELRDAYAQAGDTGGFQQKLSGFRQCYAKRSAMLRRIVKL